MSAYFFDIDGTVVKYHTSEWLPGAVEMLTNLVIDGHEIIFTTMRARGRDDGKEWSVSNTEKLLSKLPFKYRVLYDVYSERIIVDDKPKGGLIHHKQNSPWHGTDRLNYKEPVKEDDLILEINLGNPGITDKKTLTELQVISGLNQVMDYGFKKGLDDGGKERILKYFYSKTQSTQLEEDKPKEEDET